MKRGLIPSTLRQMSLRLSMLRSLVPNADLRGADAISSARLDLAPGGTPAMRPGCARAAGRLLRPARRAPEPHGSPSDAKHRPASDAKHRLETALARPAFADPPPRACRLKKLRQAVRSNRRAYSLPLSGCRFATIEIQDVPASQTFFSMID